MKVLVVGGGGREHAICWKLAKSQRLGKLYCAPGNPGIASVAELVPLGAEDVQRIVEFATREGIDLVVVGPEAPLTLGIADALEERGILCFGPTKAAAEIESSKSFAKGLMSRAKIPTAAYGVFDDPEEALAFASRTDGQVAVKADGLAGGKGVIVCGSMDEAKAALDAILVEGAFGKAGAKVVVEERLFGEEASIIALVDGKGLVLLAPSQDHKRLEDGDQGPNTGGMGAYSPTPAVDEAMLARIREEILEPAIRQLAEEGRPFRGALYAGLILTEEGPKVIEFNARLGDPETQPILFRLESDLLEGMMAAAKGALEGIELSFTPEPAMTVVMAAAGYPEKPRTGDEIHGLEEIEEDVVVFQAGTAWKDGKLATSGGRVLGVTAGGPTLAEAKEKVYRACEAIRFDGVQYRSDIGHLALLKEQR